MNMCINYFLSATLLEEYMNNGHHIFTQLYNTQMNVFTSDYRLPYNAYGTIYIEYSWYKT